MRSVLIFVISFLPVLEAVAQDTTYIQWGPPRQISFDPYNSAAPSILAVGDTIHLGWSTSDGPAAYYARSCYAGLAWSEPNILDDTTGGLYIRYPDLAAARSFAYVFWWRYELSTGGRNQMVIDLRRSLNAGVTWLPRVTVARDPHGDWYSNEYAFAKDTMVGLVALRLGAADQFGFSSDTGVNWAFYDAQTNSFDRFIILSDGVHLVREQWGTGAIEVGYLYSSDFGSTWTTPVFLSTTDGILSDQPWIAGTDEGNLLVVWRDFKYGGSADATILLRRSEDFGRTWLSEQSLTTSATGNTPKVVVDGLTVAVAWNDVATGTTVRLSMNGGKSFYGLQTLAQGGDVSVALARAYVHVSWRAWAGGNPEIHYRRGRIITTSIGEENRVPQELRLYENFPNPFNAETVIRFSLPERSWITMKVYDVLGRLVAILAEDILEAGEHRVRFDARSLTSGVYYYKLQTIKSYSVKKCLLLK